MSRTVLSIFKSAFSPLSDSDCKAYSQYVSPSRNAYDATANSVEAIVGEGDPSLSEGNCLSLKQQRMMRRAVYVHA